MALAGLMLRIALLNGILLLIVLGLLVVVVRSRRSVQASEAQLNALVQDLETKLPALHQQLTTRHQQLVTLRNLVKAVLSQLPRLPGYWRQLQGLR